MYGFIWKAAIPLGAVPLHVSGIASDLELRGADDLKNCTGFVQGHDDQEMRNQLSINASIHSTDSPQFGNLVRQSDILYPCAGTR